MKKAIKIVLVVILVVYAVFATTVLFIAAEEQMALKVENEELTEKLAEVDPMDLLPYKLFYDSLVQDEYDLNKAVEDAAEEYGLNEVDELTLLKNVEWLATMVVALSGD